MDRQYTILVADRNSRVRGFLQRELMAEGYHVQLAEDGKQVLKKVYHSDPLDLLILDPDLPDSDENVLLKRLRNRIPSLPVIVHALQQEGDAYEFLPNDAVFVEKGGKSVEHLKLVVAEILHKKNSNRRPNRSD